MESGHGESAGGRRGRTALLVATVAGCVHGGFSLLWGLGSDLLIWSVGRELTDQFTGRRWILLLVGAFKIAAAVLPLALTLPWVHSGWRLLLRAMSWLGAAVLILWGGIGLVVAHLVLAGVVASDGYDRGGMIGHAWLWDPLFVLWGVALASGLWSSRPGRLRRGSPVGHPGHRIS